MQQSTAVPYQVKRRLLAVGGLLIGGGAMLPASVMTCPVCDTGTGRQVRSTVLGSDLGYNLLVTALPFLVFALIVAAIYYGIPAPWSAHHRAGKGAESR